MVVRYLSAGASALKRLGVRLAISEKGKEVLQTALFALEYHGDKMCKIEKGDRESMSCNEAQSEAQLFQCTPCICRRTACCAHQVL